MKKNTGSSEISPFRRGFLKVFWFFASLKLAISVLLGLAAALTAGTFVESWFDTPTAQYWVYRAFWFRALLGLLGINIFTVAMSRYPWKRKHIPFLMAHLGILLLLWGSWVTDQVGLDGLMRITEGESTSAVDVDSPYVFINDQGSYHSIPLPWVPPGVRFKPVSLKTHGVPHDLWVDQMISHADPEFHFFPSEKAVAEVRPAVRIQIAGGPMRISQEFWLWAGQPGWSAFQAGPAWLSLGTREGMPSQGPRLFLNPEKDGGLSYEALSSAAIGFNGGTVKGPSQGVVKGRWATGKVTGQVIQTPWRGGITVSILEWIPNAELEVKYKPSRVQYREMAPPPAIRIVNGKGGKGAEAWLGQGERAFLQIGNRNVEVGYYRKSVMLPFSVRLERFTIERYEGTMNPASYASQVTVLGSRSVSSQAPVEISMNEPLKVDGVTIYQASYEDAMPRPVTSIFSINRDPGRVWKYLGSILIVLGSILLFVMKQRAKAKQPSLPSVEAASKGEVKEV